MAKLFQLAVVLGAIATILSGVQAISKVSRAGRYLYTDDGNRFYIKGIAYQEQGSVVADTNNPFLEPSTFIDPLDNGAACNRDLPYLTQLGVNTIRVYSVDSTLNHDACMNAFSAAGIYTIIDLSLPLNGSIDRLAPAWSSNILDLYINTINAFSKYDNVLAYNVGNEVVIAPNGTAAATFVKAAARDVKAYLASKSSSALVGYAAIDGDASWTVPLAEYLSCDPTSNGSGNTAIDLYGLNNYEWCGDSTFEASYAGTESNFQGITVPAYFSEFGCITSPPRVWTEVEALFSSRMSDVWSGGLAFSYFPAASAAGQFGIVNISADGKSVTTSADFTALKTEYGKVTPPNSPSRAAAGPPSYAPCPPASPSLLASTSLPPTPNDAACLCLERTLSCVFKPSIANYSIVLGPLLDYACSLLGQKGGSCADISANGSTAVYGRVASCDPAIKLSFVFSEYYEANNRNPTACSFGGNGTVNAQAPSSISAANSAASSCISNPSATFTPTGAATTPATHGATTSASHRNGAVTVFADSQALVGLAALTVFGVVSCLWTLASV